MEKFARTRTPHLSLLPLPSFPRAALDDVTVSIPLRSALYSFSTIVIGKDSRRPSREPTPFSSLLPPLPSFLPSFFFHLRLDAHGSRHVFSPFFVFPPRSTVSGALLLQALELRERRGEEAINTSLQKRRRNTGHCLLGDFERRVVGRRLGGEGMVGKRRFSRSDSPREEREGARAWLRADMPGCMSAKR